MLRTFVTGACLAALLAACATNREAATPAKAAAAPSSCLTETGPRVPLKSGRCAAYGRSYSGAQINQTGQQNAGEALQMLDPSITTHR
ncbi:MAG: hypothetical protein JWN85_2451 [Gammaproteobacteria bacterium]|nr:hypothetical protein [Gammaproteobacteria bacterium]